MVCISDHERGFSLTELLIAIALGAILAAAAVPPFTEMIKRGRHDAAVRQVLSDVHEARSRAITRGWEYRVVGHDGDSTGARRNQYRLLGRRSSTVAWPAEESAVTNTPNQVAEPWVDVADRYDGIRLDTPNSQFQLTFDSRGTAPGAPTAFNPLRLVDEDGREARIRISRVGGVQLE